MQRIVATAPVRLDLAGGTLDIWPLYLTLPPPALTVNVALDLPVRVTIEPRPPGDPRITLTSSDRGETATFADLPALDLALRRGSGGLKLLAHAVAALRPTDGFTLTSAATSPAGAGLGGSSALLVTVLGALLAAQGRASDTEGLRRLAQDLEATLLRGPTGYQDYYPPLLGGCLRLEGRAGGLSVRPLNVDLAALGRRLRLIYTGEPHHSGLTNWGMLRAYLDGEEPAVRGLGAVADAAREVSDLLERGDLDGALRAVVDEGRMRIGLAEGVSTPAIQTLDDAVRGAGAWGTKICGAGGGGCVLVVLPPDPLGEPLERALRQPGASELPVRLVSRGLDVRRG